MLFGNYGEIPSALVREMEVRSRRRNFFTKVGTKDGEDGASPKEVRQRHVSQVTHPELVELCLNINSPRFGIERRHRSL